MQRVYTDFFLTPQATDRYYQITYLGRNLYALFERIDGNNAVFSEIIRHDPSNTEKRGEIPIDANAISNGQVIIQIIPFLNIPTTRPISYEKPIGSERISTYNDDDNDRGSGEQSSNKRRSIGGKRRKTRRTRRTRRTRKTRRKRTRRTKR
jgi:hypothetical protein